MEKGTRNKEQETRNKKQTNSYYPFGLTMLQNNGNTSDTYKKNKYLYNSKEIQDDNLNSKFFGMLDYGARFYDPQIGRFTTLDPDADQENQESESPYCYVACNPISRNDPDGRTWWDAVNGTARGYLDNIAGTDTRSSFEPTDADQYNKALDHTDKASAVLGASMIVGGTDAAIGGAATSATGVGIAVGVLGVVTALEGGAMAVNAVKHLAQGNHYGEKKGSKNLIEEAKESQAKKETANQRQDKRDAATEKGKSKTGKSNTEVRGNHTSNKNGNKDYDKANARRAKEQKKADEKKK